MDYSSQTTVFTITTPTAIMALIKVLSGGLTASLEV